MALLALLAAVAVAGCLGPAPPTPDPSAPAETGCGAFAACLFSQDGPLEVVVHRSPGMPYPRAGLEALADQVLLVSGRALMTSNGSDVAALAQIVEDGELWGLHDAGRSDRLDLYVLDTVRMEGEEPTSGLSFPGSSAVFLFPGTLDQRVGQAGLEDADKARARQTVEAVVLAHEFGHALGLVGCGIPMQAPHAHPESGCHSANATSLMAPRVARVSEWPAWDPAAPLGPFAWDGDDLADLAAFRASVA